VARDRKRAKQRRDRRATRAARRSAAPGVVPPTEPTRADVPGALDHASSDVDEFDAALVRGAGGVAAEPEAGGAEGAAGADGVSAGAELEEEPDSAADQETELEAEPEAAPVSASGGGARDGGGGAAVAAGDRERAPAAQPRGGNRAIQFLQASWAELQRVQWPDRRQVTQATAVVLGFVIVSGVYLGVADFVAKEIVEFVLG
jgi:preprotein translocase subunit SecE